MLTDKMIPDRIVIEVRDKAAKLWRLKEEELDLNKALSIGRTNEAASKQLNFMKQEEIETDKQVNALDMSNEITRQEAQKKTPKMERIAADVEEQSNIQ